MRDWGYRCVLTAAQIEIMQSDLPHTLWNDRKKRFDEKEDPAYELSMKALERSREKRRRAQAEKEKEAKERGEGFSLDEVFEGLADKD